MITGSWLPASRASAASISSLNPDKVAPMSIVCDATLATAASGEPSSAATSATGASNSGSPPNRRASATGGAWATSTGAATGSPCTAESSVSSGVAKRGSAASDFSSPAVTGSSTGTLAAVASVASVAGSCSAGTSVKTGSPANTESPANSDSPASGTAAPNGSPASGAAMSGAVTGSSRSIPASSGTWASSVSGSGPPASAAATEPGRVTGLPSRNALAAATSSPAAVRARGSAFSAVTHPPITPRAASISAYRGSLPGRSSASSWLSTCSIAQPASPNSPRPTIRLEPFSVWKPRRIVVRNC